MCAKAFGLAVLVAVLVLVPETLSAQCAMCRSALESPEGQQMVAALRSGVLLLLAAPFIAFGAVAAVAIRIGRRRTRQGPVRSGGLEGQVPASPSRPA
jgi:hypothetical protein